MVLFTYINKRYELGLNLFQLLLIFLVSVLQVFEGTTRIDIVARIDAHLLAILCSNIGGMSRKMNIGHQWGVIAISLQTGRDILHILSLTSTLCGKTNQFTASIDDTLSLRHTGLSIVSICGRHRLDADGVIAADFDITDMSYTANSSCSHTSTLLNPYLPFQSLPSSCPYIQLSVEQ